MFDCGLDLFLLKTTIYHYTFELHIVGIYGRNITTNVKSTTFLSFSVDWPFGTYTLVKPKSGCPRGWLEGWRHQDNEDSRAANSITPGHHFAGTNTVAFLLKNISFSSCIKS